MLIILITGPLFLVKNLVQYVNLQFNPFCYHSRVKAFFVVGHKACDIPPPDRLDPHTCEEWTPEVPGKSKADLLDDQACSN